MKRFYRYLWVGILLLTFLPAQDLDPRFHSWKEIVSLLDSIADLAEYEDYMLIDTIGYSTQEQIPILAVKISDNVRVFEDQPRVLFVGQVHAEEVLGVEAVLKLIEVLLDPEPSQIQHVNILLQNLEIWIVPTANPEGMNVVFEGLDISYRKNKHDFSPTGIWPNLIFDYDPSIGNDVDGVDINRNFDFNWAFGDTFLQPDASDYGAHYDYFRGLSPWSERETVALRNFALAQDFLFSIVWHSSRSGLLSEKVFTPWQWEDTRYPPDTEAMKDIGDILASLIEKEDGSGNYLSEYGKSRNGKAHDWFYKETGCFQYLIECGTSNIQPDSALIEDTVDRLLPAMFYLMDRSIGYNGDAAQISGRVFDASSGSVIENAIVSIDELDGGVLTNRYSDNFGRFRRIANPGTYHVRVRKFGYNPQVAILTANNSVITYNDFLLNPAQIHSITLDVISETGSLTEDILCIYENDIYCDTLQLNPGANSLQLPEGIWAITVQSGNLIPWIKSLVIDQDQAHTVNLLEPVFEYSFITETADSILWPIRNGTWHFSNTIKTQSGTLYSNADSTGNIMFLYSDLIHVSPNINKVALKISQRYELEWDYDSIKVVLLDSMSQTIFEWSQSGQNWASESTKWLTVADTSGIDNIRVRLLFKRDQTVNYRGWELGELTLLGGHDSFLSIQNEMSGDDHSLPGFISNPYPNPSTGIISIDLKYISLPAELIIYNLLGQQVTRQKIDQLSGRRHTMLLNLANIGTVPMSSGMYFVKIKTNDRIFLKKCIYLKN